MSILKKASDQKKLRRIKAPSSKWDLYGDGPNSGLSYSIMSKFVVCRERTRLRLVEGLVPVNLREAMEFGTIFHKALEFDGQMKTTSQILAAMRAWAKRTSADMRLVRIAVTMIPFYKTYWKEDFKKYRVLENEKIFKIPYHLLGKTINLRGRRDSVLIKDGKLWLLEHKTKSNINELKIEKTLPFDLQTMLYMWTLRHDFKQPLGGVLYNVIRKPGLVQGGKENESAYLERLSKDIDKRPEHYFKIFEVEIDDAHLTAWRKRSLDPIISQIIIWWESIKNNPFEPWVCADGQPNPHHFERPFGVYDPMSVGVGDYFEKVVGGTNFGLRTVDSAFPELEGEQGGSLSKGKKRA